MTYGKWYIWGASVRGPLHIKEGIPNQDAWLAKSFLWGNVIVAADGLGSKKHSDIGAQAICEAVIEIAETERQLRLSTLESPSIILKKIHQRWLTKLSDYQVNDCCSTCLFVIQDGSKIQIGQLGDGMVAAMSDTEPFKVLIDDKDDGFSNTTNCLNNKFNPHHWTVKLLKNTQYDRFLICTDGIADDLIFEVQEAFCRDVITTHQTMDMYERNKALTLMLNQWPVKGHMDDKTLVVLCEKLV